MTVKFEKDAKVKITNLAGGTEDSTDEPGFRIIGETGYVLEQHNEEWVSVVIPTNRYFSRPQGALLRVDEVELVK